MPSVKLLLELAAREEGVGIMTNPKRVSEYFASYGEFATKKNASDMIQISWCQLFANWVLLQAGYPLLQRTYGEWVKNEKDNVDNGFQYMFKSKLTKYKPQPGDLYYAPVVRNKTTHHMGFIVEDLGGGRYLTIDGNTGDETHPLYYKTLWNGTKSGSLNGGIGGGIVCFNQRIDNGGGNVKIDGFLKLPSMLYSDNPYE